MHWCLSSTTFVPLQLATNFQSQMVLTIFKVHLIPKPFFPKTIELIMWSNLPQKNFDLLKSLVKVRQNAAILVHERVYRGMGQRPDVTSNPEHDDSEIRIFTCFFGKGWESCLKKMPARCVVVGCSNTTNLQEVLRFMPLID